MISRIAVLVVASWLIGGCASPPVEPVAFELGAAEFHGGDAIDIEEVRSTSPGFEPGAVVTVRGRYRLASHTRGTLYLGTTTTRSAAIGDDPDNTVTVARGDGVFELTHRIPAEGYLHVTFYDVITGAPFGGRYFGRGDTLLVTKDWSYAR